MRILKFLVALEHLCDRINDRKHQIDRNQPNQENGRNCVRITLPLTESHLWLKNLTSHQSCTLERNRTIDQNHTLDHDRDPSKQLKLPKKKRKLTYPTK